MYCPMTALKRHRHLYSGLGNFHLAGRSFQSIAPGMNPKAFLESRKVQLSKSAIDFAARRAEKNTEIPKAHGPGRCTIRLVRSGLIKINLVWRPSATYARVARLGRSIRRCTFHISAVICELPILCKELRSRWDRLVCFHIAFFCSFLR